MRSTIFGGIALIALSACGGTSVPIVEIDGTGALTANGGGGGPATTPVSENEDQSFGQILNNVRLGNGRNAVTYDSRLDAAAQAHADDMVDRGYFSHDADGDDNDGVETNMVGDRVLAEGYDYIAVGENLAGGGQIATEQDALDAWEDSPSHNTMMNADSLEEFGIGVAGSGNDIRWVLVMGTER